MFERRDFVGKTCGDCLYHDRTNNNGEPTTSKWCLKSQPRVIVIGRIVQQRIGLEMQNAMVPVIETHFPETRNSTPACGDFAHFIEDAKIAFSHPS